MKPLTPHSLVKGCFFSILLLSCFTLPAFGQQLTLINGGITVGNGGKIKVDGTTRLDSLSNIGNAGILHTDQLESRGNIALGDSIDSELIIDDVINLQGGLLELNSGNLVLLNSDTNALRFSNGKVKAESVTWGRVVWHIGENTGIYKVPFVNDSLEDVSMEFEITGAGNGTNGYFEISTYATNPQYFPNNLPNPAEINSHFETLQPGATKRLVDRFWLFSAEDYTDDPESDVLFKYSPDDVKGNNELSSDSLWAIKWSPGGVDTLTGTVDTSSNTFALSSVGEYAVWSLMQKHVSDPETEIFDRFGRGYAMRDVLIRDGARMGNSCQSGIFIIDFDGDEFTNHANSQDIQTVICQVFNDLTEMLVVSTCSSATPEVSILVKSYGNMPAGALAGASSYYTIRSTDDNTGIIDGDVWKAINGGVNDPSRYDGEITINFDLAPYAWNTSLTSNPTSMQYDLYSVMLHEIIHLLGFASLIDANGNSQAPGVFAEHYSRFDTKLYSNTDSKLMIDWDGCYSAEFDVPSARITSGCSNIKFDGSYVTSPQPTYAPTGGYEDGSTLSHFEIGCGASNSFVMHPNIGRGVARRVPTSEEARALCDIGYKTTGNYGDGTLAFHPSDGSLPACGVIVAGVDDGYLYTCTNNRYVVQECSTITISPLANDKGAATFDCLRLVDGTGSPSVTAGTSFVFDPVDKGIVRFTYIPVGASPDFIRGNITYIEILVLPCGNATCATPLNCNQICNHDFTALPFSIDFKNVPSWEIAYGSPDLSNGAAPTPNSAKMWAGSSATQFLGEGIYTTVNVQPNTKYIFSYQRRIDATWETLDNAHVRLIQSTTATGIPDLSTEIPSVPAISFHVLHEENVTSGSWEEVVVCFTTNNQTYDWLWIYPQQNQSRDQAWLFVDNIQLVEDNFTAGDNETTDCQDLSIGDEEVCGIPSITYEWTVESGDGGSIDGSDDQVTLHVNPNQTTEYKLTRTFPAHPGSSTITVPSAACITEDFVTVTVTDALFANLSTTNPTCSVGNNGSASSTPTGGTSPYVYEWDINSTIYTTSSVNGLSPGSYSLTVTDANECTVTESFDLTGLIVGFSNVVASFGCADGAATVVASGGTPPYTYLWDNSETTATITDLAPGTYSVTVSDAGGCTVDESIAVPAATLTDPTGFTVAANSTVFWDTDHQLGGQLIVEAGATLYIVESTIQFTDEDPGGEPNVIVMAGGISTNGGRLVIVNSLLRGLISCETMWNGIEVRGINDYFQATPALPDPFDLTSPQGAIYVFGSIIRDSRKGVLLGAETSSGQMLPRQGGGMIFVEDYSGQRSKFINNGTSIRFQPYYTGSPNVSYITHAEFICNNDFIELQSAGVLAANPNPPFSAPGPPGGSSFATYRNVAFIFMNSVQGVEIKGSSFTNTSTPPGGLPLYHNGYGIRTIDASYSVDCYLNPGMVCNQNSFTNLYIAIESKGTLALNPLNIRACEFTDNQGGVRLTNVNGSNIQANQFLIPEPGVRKTWGITLNGSSNFNVWDDNTFDGQGGGSFVHNYGIVVNNSGTGGGIIQDCFFEDSDFGLQVQGFNPDLDIHCNTFAADGNAHYRHAWANVAGNPNTFLKDQGRCSNRPTDPAGNKWMTNDFTTTTASFAACSTDLAPARDMFVSPVYDFDYFHHEEDIDLEVKNIPVCSTPLWRDYPHLIECTGRFETSLSCVTVFQRLGAGPEDMPAFRAAAESEITEHLALIDSLNLEWDTVQALLDDSLKSSLLGAINNVALTSSTLTSLLISHSPLSDDVMQAAIYRSDGRAPLSPVQIRNMLAESMPLTKRMLHIVNYSPVSLPDSIVESIYTLHNGGPFDPARTDLYYIEKELQSEKTSILQLENELRRQYLLVGDTINEMDVLLKSTLSQSKKVIAERYLARGMFDSCEAYLDTVDLLGDIVSDLEDKTYIATMNILMDILDDTTIYAIDSVDVETLESIAADTTLAAALIAQNTLSKVFGAEYNFTIYDIPSGGAKRSKEPEESKVAGVAEKTWFSLYPNPNTGTMTIEYFINTDGTFVMHDLLGRIVRRLTLTSGYNKTVIKAENDEAGLYLYQILDSDGNKWKNGRVLILPD